MPVRSSAESRYRIAVVHRTFDVLEFLANQPGQKLTQIALSCGVPKGSAMRLLRNLEDRELVRRDVGSGQYWLGPACLRLGNRAASSLNLRAIALPIMQQLQRQSGETVDLAVEMEGRVAYVEIVAPDRGLQMSASIGQTDDMHSTALGKVLLAAKSNEAIKSYLQTHPLTRRTPNTIVDSGALRRSLVTIRDRGYAVSDEENELGARCVAVPVLGVEAAPVAALGISGPTTRVKGDRVDELAQMAQLAATSLSRGLGSVPHIQVAPKAAKRRE